MGVCRLLPLAAMILTELNFDSTAQLGPLNPKLKVCKDSTKIAIEQLQGIMTQVFLNLNP